MEVEPDDPQVEPQAEPIGEPAVAEKTQEAPKEATQEKPAEADKICGIFEEKFDALAGLFFCNFFNFLEKIKEQIKIKGKDSNKGSVEVLKTLGDAKIFAIPQVSFCCRKKIIYFKERW